MNEAGGGERGSRCSGSSQTPCKESCHAAGLDTLARPPRGRFPRQSTRRDPELSCLRAGTPGLVTAWPCPSTFLSLQLLPSKPKPGLPVLAEAGALITPPGAACASTPRTTCPCPWDATKHRHLLLPAEAFEGEKYPIFPPKRLCPKRKREPGEYSPVPAPIHQPAPSGSEPE